MVRPVTGCLLLLLDPRAALCWRRPLIEPSSHTAKAKAHFRVNEPNLVFRAEIWNFDNKRAEKNEKTNLQTSLGLPSFYFSVEIPHKKGRNESKTGFSIFHISATKPKKTISQTFFKNLKSRAYPPKKTLAEAPAYSPSPKHSSMIWF